MKSMSLKGIGLTALMAVCLISSAILSGCNSAPQQGGLRTSMIDSNDQLESKDVVADAVPAAGAPSVQVTETIHYINVPAFKHNTQYQIKRTVTAVWVGKVNVFVLHDNEGNWYSFQAGSAAANKLSDKPQASIGAQAAKLDSNDQGSVLAVTASSGGSGNPTLNVTYSYIHPEALDNEQYTVAGTVGTTFVQDQNAYFAYVSGSLYRVDRSGQATRLNDKPSVDRGELNSLIDRHDTTASYPDVTFDGGFFEAHWGHVHEQEFEHVRYTTLQEVRSEFVPELNSYLAWIDGTEYAANSSSHFVQRLTARPVVTLGARSNNIGYDRPARVDVFSVTDKDVVVRYSFHRDETYVTKEYYVDRPGVLYYNQTWQVWMVAIDGTSYVVAFDSDSFSDPSATIIHAPAGAARPQYSVPSTSGDGLPPAVVPGRDNGTGTTPASPVASPAVLPRPSLGVLRRRHRRKTASLAGPANKPA